MLSKMKIREYKFIILGFFLGILFWIIDSILDVVAFNLQDDLLIQIFFPRLHEIWVRVIIMFLFIFLGIYAHISQFKKMADSEYKLKERVKELNCLYGISKIIEKPNISIEKILTRTLLLIPPAWQFPEVTCARIFYNHREFTSENYKKSRFKLTSKVEINKKELILEVNYLKDNQFLEEEKYLITDITERLKVILEEKEAEIELAGKDKLLEKKVQDLKESEEKYRNLFENSLVGIVILKGFQVIAANIALLEIFGYSNFEKFKKLSILDHILPKDKKIKMKRIRKREKGEIVPSKLEIKIKRKDGEIRNIELSSSEIFLGDESYLQSTVQDITERKRVEKLVIEENLKLAELNKIKKSLITRVSHELKTPLNAIVSASHVLLNFYENDMSENIKEHNQIIYKGGQRLKDLIENLLDISKLDESKLELNKKKEDLVKIIHESVGDLTFMAKNRLISISLDLPDELEFELDKLRIEQVITNVVSNAIKNTPKGGKIYLSMAKNDDYLEISIKDTGVGLTEDEKQKLFIKFGKIERHGKGLDVDTEGSGLGLFISKNLIDLHEGQLLVESDGRNKGATFKIRLYENKPLTSTNI